MAAYVAASRRHVDGTTEVTALVVLAAGLLAGTGAIVLASALFVVTTLLLVEKPRLHSIVARIDDAGLRAGVRFAVMAIVILPLLPRGPLGPLGAVRPRQLWFFVLLFSGLSFAGYLVRRVVGTERGYSVAGLLGGFLSSTAVAFTFARTSRENQSASFPSQSVRRSLHGDEFKSARRYRHTSTFRCHRPRPLLGGAPSRGLDHSCN